jgi:hypothetical protein
VPHFRAIEPTEGLSATVVRTLLALSSGEQSLDLNSCQYIIAWENFAELVSMVVDTKNPAPSDTCCDERSAPSLDRLRPKGQS